MANAVIVLAKRKILDTIGRVLSGHGLFYELVRLTRSLADFARVPV